MKQEDINRVLIAQVDYDAADTWRRDWQDCEGEFAALVRAFAHHRIAQAERVKVLEEALGSVLCGGNHLALLIGPDHPPHTATASEALEHYGSSDTYEIWCCWQAIMRARTALEQTGASHG